MKSFWSSNTSAYTVCPIKSGPGASGSHIKKKVFNKNQFYVFILTYDNIFYNWWKKCAKMIEKF